MTTYTVTAKRWVRGWELHIGGVGVTQSHGLADAEMMARDLIASYESIPVDSFDVEIVPELDEELAAEAAEARRAVADAGEAQRRAAEKSRTVARELKAAGLSGRDVATVLHLSPQRVSQLIRRAS